MQKLNPEAKFYTCGSINEAGCTLCNECPYMALNNMEKLLHILKHENNEIILEEATSIAAQKPLQRMLEIS